MRHVTINFQSEIRTKKNGKTARLNRANGRVFLHLKAGAKQSQTALHYEAIEVCSRAGWKVTEGNCRVILRFAWNGRADVIGLAETVLDAMEGIVYKNDRQARWVEMTMLPKENKSNITCQATIYDYQT